MKPALLALPMALAACASVAAVEAFDPAAADRRAPLAVRHPGGQTWALDADVLQREAVERLRGMGYADVRALPPGAAGEGRVLILQSEQMARPLEDNGDFASGGLQGMGHPRRTCAGERVRAVARLLDGRGGLLYQGVLVEGLSSSLTEARVAEALLRPLEG